MLTLSSLSNEKFCFFQLLTCMCVCVKFSKMNTEKRGQGGAMRNRIERESASFEMVAVRLPRLRLTKTRIVFLLFL